MDVPGELHCLVPGSRPLSPTGDGELARVRAAVKDCIAVAGHRSSFGHPRWRHTHAEATRDADVVERLRASGAEIVGLAKMDQLAYSLIGNAGEGEPPVNPHDPACFCGGSSSGSASAVAGGVADLGVGTDTCGSIRVPAAACGLFSIRPTHGRIGVGGVIALARSLDVVGFVARDPALLERALAATAGVTETARASRGPIARVLVPRGLAGRASARAGSTPPLIGLAERLASEVVGEAGRRSGTAAIAEVDGAKLVNAEIGDLMARIQGREIWAEHAGWIEDNIGSLAPDVQARLERCRRLSQDGAEVVAADLGQRQRYRDHIRRILGEDGVLVMPVLPRRGPRRDWSEAALLAFRQECFRLTAPSSLAGVPQVVLAGGSPPAGPALSLIGAPHADGTLLALARRLTSPGTAPAGTDRPG